MSEILWSYSVCTTENIIDSKDFGVSFATDVLPGKTLGPTNVNGVLTLKSCMSLVIRSLHLLVLICPFVS